jgi:phage tail sheath gpL-like
MASSVILTIKSELTQAQAQTLLKRGSDRDKEGLRSLRNFLRAIPNQTRAIIDVQTGSAAPVAASGTVTCASVAVNDTVTIGNVTFTAKASPASETEFSQAGSDTADGASLAAKINAHSTLQYAVSASAASGVVTITCKQKGVIGNCVGLTSSNGTRLAVSGSGFLASGTGGASDTANTYTLGL